MTILKTLTNTAEVIFYYLILFVVAVVNVFISSTMDSRSAKAGNSNRNQRSGNQGMAMGSVN